MISKENRPARRHSFRPFSGGRIAEVVHTELAQIRAVAYETLAQLPTQSILPLLDDSFIAKSSAAARTAGFPRFENSEEARQIVEQFVGI